MRNSVVLMVVAAATAIVASPIVIPTATTRTSVTPTPAVFPDGFIISVPEEEKVNTTAIDKVATVIISSLTKDVAERKQQEAEDLDPYYSEGTTDKEDGENEEARAWREYWDTMEEAEWNSLAEKRDGARKHGVVCTVL